MSINSSEQFHFFDSITAIPTVDWSAIIPRQNVFLSLEFLFALENSLRPSLKLIPVLIYNSEKKPLVAGVFQISTFIYKKTANQSSFLKIFQDCRNTDDSFSIKGLVCGNIFATGENGFAFSNEISKEEAITLMATAAQKLKNNDSLKNEFSIMLFKEFWEKSVGAAKRLEAYKYRPFQIDVNMVLQMDSHWQRLEDYLGSMKAKYRAKANSAYKKSAALSIRELSEDDIQKYEQDLVRLFNNVLQKSHYSYGVNYPLCFFNLKKNLGNRFHCRGFFFGEKLVGFSTAFENCDNLEANYVGIDYGYNSEFAVYERILYDYVELAISLKVDQLHLGRTSELIKSALGALPEAMTLYARHTSKMKNILLKPVLENIYPSEFELRKPFLK
ncbi:hypothetical protein [Aequorivita echinoideorum]|nr:hypothetical protein [Aequorivita echinoideorum]